MLAEILEPIVQHFARNRQLYGPQEAEIHRAGTGAGIIVTVAWWTAYIDLEPKLHQQVVALVQQDGRVPAMPLIAGAGWLVFFLVGLLLLCVGATRSRGDRDFIVAAKACAWIFVAGALLWYRAYFDDAPVLNGCLLKLYLWTLASGTTWLFLSMRGMHVGRLPDPETQEDLPMSGPASRDQARDGMSGKDDWTPPRFSD